MKSLDNFHINNILKRLEKSDFDAMFLANFNNIRYLTGYLPTSFSFLIIKENPIIYVSAMDMEMASKTSSCQIKKFESFNDLVNDLKEENIKKLAIEEDLTVGIYTKFMDFELEISNFVDLERRIKSEDEILKMDNAVNIAHESLIDLDVRSKQESGWSEWECSYELGRIIREKGAEMESFDTIFASGTETSLPHSVPGHKVLETPILVDYGCKFEGYCSDTTRTFIYTEKQEEISSIVLEAHDKAIAGIKEGVVYSEIDNIAREIISEYGYGDNFIHSTGHNLGLDIHENPNVSIRDNNTIEKNMVFTIEPGIYIEGEFGVRIEDMVLVDKKGIIMGNLPIYL